MEKKDIKEVPAPFGLEILSNDDPPFPNPFLGREMWKFRRISCSRGGIGGARSSAAVP